MKNIYRETRDNFRHDINYFQCIIKEQFGKSVTVTYGHHPNMYNAHWIFYISLYSNGKSHKQTTLCEVTLTVVRGKFFQRGEKEIYKAIDKTRLALLMPIS